MNELRELRCLALVTDAYGGGGGIACYNRDVLGALARISGIADVTIVPRSAVQVIGPVPDKLRQLRAPSGLLSYVWAVLSVALSQRVDLVFCGHVHLAPLAAMMARLKGARLIVQVHGIEVWGKLRPLNRRALEFSDMVFCVSRHTRAMILSKTTITPERAVVTSNTMGDTFVPGNRAAARKAWGFGEEKILLCVGRMDRREQYKGQDRVIAALPALLNRGVKPLFVIVGEGDDRPRLEAWARDAGVAGHVRFLGNVGDDRLQDLYRAADLFVMPSTGEGFGIVYLEAMACGTPAIGLAAGGAPDPLCDGMLGVATDEAGLMAALLEGLSSPPRDSLADDVRRRFGRQAFTHRIEALLARLESAPCVIAA